MLKGVCDAICFLPNAWILLDEHGFKTFVKEGQLSKTYLAQSIVKAPVGRRFFVGCAHSEQRLRGTTF